MTTLIGKRLRLWQRQKKECITQTVEVMNTIFKDGKECYTLKEEATGREFIVIKSVFDNLYITNHNIKPNWERKFKGEAITSKQNKF